MIQRGQRLRFALEAGQALGIVAEEIGQDLDRDVPLEPGVAGAIDFSHAAGADRGHDLERAEPRPWSDHRKRGDYMRVLLVSACLLLAACGSPPAPPETPQVPPPPDVAAAPADAIRTSSNLASKVLQPGRGSRHPRPNSEVTVHYTGWTTDGKTFDSSVARGEPATFRLDEVVPGWTEGLQMMVEGEKRRFWIPGRLAYDGVPGRPQGTLVFDIELIRISS